MSTLTAHSFLTATQRSEINKANKIAFVTVIFFHHSRQIRDEVLEMKHISFTSNHEKCCIFGKK